MAWTVRVQDESGKPVSDDFDIGFDEIPSGPQYPICSSVARYYNTWLNPDQLRTFMSEWDKAVHTPEFSYLRDKRTIRDIAEKTEKQQLYLRFVGD